MTPRPPVGEGCNDPHGISYPQQAKGILQIHEHCVPPCPRKRAAEEFLRWHPPSEEN